MAENVFNDLLYIDQVPNDTRTETDFKNLLKNTEKEYYAHTPKFEIEFKKALTCKRKYYTSIIENETKKQLNKCLDAFDKNTSEIHYQYLYNRYFNNFLNYINEIASYIQEKKLSENLFLTPSKDNKSDEAYVLFFLKANAIFLLMELQERFHKYSEEQILLQEEIHEVYFSEIPPENLYVHPYQGKPIQIKKATTKSKIFKAIKGDLESRSENPKLLTFSELLNSSKTNLFSMAEEALFAAEIIDKDYNFIPTRGNKIILAAFIFKLFKLGYFNERTFPGPKQIKERQITKYFAHRYGNDSDTDREFRNFKKLKRHQYTTLVQKYHWLDNIS